MALFICNICGKVTGPDGCYHSKEKGGGVMTGEELYELGMEASKAAGMDISRTWEDQSIIEVSYYDNLAERLTNWNLGNRIASLSVSEKQEIYEQLYREGCRIYK